MCQQVGPFVSIGVIRQQPSRAFFSGGDIVTNLGPLPATWSMCPQGIHVTVMGLQSDMGSTGQAWNKPPPSWGVPSAMQNRWVCQCGVCVTDFRPISAMHSMLSR
jgi:hypothetical protein